MAKTRVSTGQINPSLKFDGTRGIVVPKGSTAQRNGAPESGEIRYNTDLNLMEIYNGSAWGSMGPFPFAFTEYFTGDGTTVEFPLTRNVADQDDIIVTLNGVQQRAGLDFRIIDGTILSFTEDDSTANPPLDGAEINVRGFSPITSASIPAGSITLNELAFSDGTSGQVLTTNGAGVLTFQSIPTQDPVVGGDVTGTASNISINENTISIRELNVSDGTIGQVLATDGSGNLSFITVSGGGAGGGGASNFFDLTGQIAYSQIPDDLIDIAKLDVTDGSSGQVLSTNGSGVLSFISLPSVLNDFTDVSVSGPSNGQVLSYNSSSGNWEAQTVSVADQNLWATVSGDSGSTTANSATDTLTIAGGTGISTAVSGDTLTITNSSPNVDQNIWSAFAADTGSTTANTTTDTLTITGGTGISTSISGDTLTITNTNTIPNVFSTISVAGQTDVTADNSSDTLTLVAGTDVTITTSGNSITINSTASGGGGSGTVNSGTASRLAYYATTGTAVSETSSGLTWNNSTGTLSVTTLDATNLSITNLEAENITATGAGVPTFSSGSDIVFDLPGDVRISGAKISEVADPTSPTDVATKRYVDENTITSIQIGADDSTLRTINNGESFRIIGGSGITTSSNAEGDITVTSSPGLEWTLGANGTSDFTFSGPGFPTTQNDPDLYLYKGFTYRFNNTANGASHPLLIKTTPGTGTANQYTDGVSGSSTGTVIFEVPMNAPSTLYYQCEFHAGMVGTINIV